MRTEEISTASFKGGDMNNSNWARKTLSAFKDDLDFRFECIIIDVTEKMATIMAKRRLKRKDVASKMGISAPAVTRILSGNANFTLRTLLSIADALGRELQIDFRTKDAKPSIITRDVKLLDSANPPDSEPLCIEQNYFGNMKRKPSCEYAGDAL